MNNKRYFTFGMFLIATTCFATIVEEGQGRFANLLSLEVGKSKTSITLCFDGRLEERVRQSLILAANRGVKVKVIVPVMAATSVVFPDCKNFVVCTETISKLEGTGKYRVGAVIDDKVKMLAATKEINNELTKIQVITTSEGKLSLFEGSAWIIKKLKS